MRYLFPLACVIIIAIAFTFAPDKLRADEDDTSTLKPVEVFNTISGMRDNVKSGMKKNEISMAKIAIAIPRGDYESIVEEADKIDRKYAIESELSPDESNEYLSLIPIDFIFMDQSFHTYVNSLVSSAKEKDLENTLIQFDLTMRSCVDCHYDYAKERFPELARSEIE